MGKIFLVDTENVNSNSIANCENLNKDDMIVLFLTTLTEKHFNKNKLNTKANIVKIYVQTGTKNSLDFQLISFLGFMLGEHKGECNKYYIVSKDKGFLSSINLLVNCSNQYIKLISSINDIDSINTLADRFKKQGFRQRTSEKMARLTTSSDSFECAINEFNSAFNRNNNIIQSCKYIIGLYFNLSAKEVEKVI